MSFIQGKTVYGGGGEGTVPHKQWHTLPKGLGASRSFRELEKATQNQDMIGLEIGDVFIRLTGLFSKVR